jgi:hypothetical protein
MISTHEIHENAQQKQVGLFSRGSLKISPGGIMLHSGRIPLTIVALMMAALGCVTPAVTDQDSDAVNTAVAETLIAEFVQISLSQTLPPTFSFPTLTPGLPTITPPPLRPLQR